MSNVDKEYLNNLRHSASHLLAAAILEIWPDAKPTLGPPIEDGFYYDFDNLQLTTDPPTSPAKHGWRGNLQLIEEKMKEIVKSWKGFERVEVTPEEGKKQFKDNEYKIELIDEFTSPPRHPGGSGATDRILSSSKDSIATLQSDRKEKQPLTIYKSGSFIDLCRGGHVENPAKELKHFKLLSIAGAYWRGDEKNKMLTRIYGTAFPTKQELNEFLKMREEAKKRDHRKLGKELDLYTISNLVGQGLPLFTPKGAILRETLENFIESLNKKYGYLKVWIPHLAKPELYKTSGHWDKFKDDLFHIKGKENEFVVKPMNCPHHTQIYASQPRSYKDLPIRYYETTTVYRDELSGELGGLTRVRCITQDDGHTFLRPDQIEEEFDTLLGIQWELLKAVNLNDFWISLSLRDPKNKKAYIGDEKDWEKSQAIMRELLLKRKINFKEVEGEAAFYGPKMDLMVKDSLNREWQLSTIQLDFNMPKRFKLVYTDKNGKKKTPVMIHRAFMGSTERFIGVLIEHFAGAFPLWLSPVQMQIIPVGKDHIKYSQELAHDFKQSNIRIQVDSSNETVSNKIRKAEKEKIPYMLVIGNKEVQGEKLTVRQRGKKEQYEIGKEKFVKDVLKEIGEKKYPLTNS